MPEEMRKKRGGALYGMQDGLEERWTPLGDCLPRTVKDCSFLAKTPKFPKDKCCLFRHNSLSLLASQRQSLQIKQSLKSKTSHGIQLCINSTESGQGTSVTD